jgi:regulator of sigma E protease
MAFLGFQDAALLVATAQAGAAGIINPGDLLRTFNGAPIRDLFQLREQLVAANRQSAEVVVLRDHQEEAVTLSLTPIEAQRPDGPATYYMLPLTFVGQPIEPEPVVEVYRNPLLALGFGVRQTFEQTVELTDNIKNLVMGEIPMKALGGPMLIAKVAGDSAKHGLQTFLGSLAMISINLGLLNLFPIPVLDGGQLVMMAAEGVRRKPLPESAIENFQRLGFAMVMALVILATYNDFSRFWRSMLESVTGILN